MTGEKQTVSYADRIRHLRERSGRSHADVAAAVGVQLPWYYDVESHDEETTCGLTLLQLHRLSHSLGITLRQLLATSDDFMAVQPQRLTLDDLAHRLRERVDALGIGAVEDAVGWRLEHFLNDPSIAWEEPVDFLRFSCHFVGVEWMEVVPLEPSLTA
ncbi:MAG TPA: helix-turn-helix transcriptional regulator [Tepidisphaeraceae bacterium]|jgi:transcriptional regulator with XRE-family HTH domain|nr:helix-turn-helix transcriptional regulator [Tepidisphaeraceae bacterium]